jgi:diadenosine tetraphosphate (Ap4A) HIT family hydrolase
MPTLLRKYGFRFHFFVGESDEPAHIHVSGRKCLAKIWLEPVKLQKQRGFTETELRNIIATVEEHQQEFLEAWNANFPRLS